MSQRRKVQDLIASLVNLIRYFKKINNSTSQSFSSNLKGKKNLSQAWSRMPLTPALRWQRQTDLSVFEASLAYLVNSRWKIQSENLSPKNSFKRRNSPNLFFLRMILILKQDNNTTIKENFRSQSTENRFNSMARGSHCDYDQLLTCKDASMYKLSQWQTPY